MLEHFKDIEKTQGILRQAQTGLWVIELDEGKEPRMYADDAMVELLGATGVLSPEACYKLWYERIDHEWYPMVQSGVERIILDERVEVEYPWYHPGWGKIYIRCGGVRDWSYQKGICLRGYHQNITNTVILKQEYDSVIQTLNEDYTGIFLCNLNDKTFKTIKISGILKNITMPLADYEEFFRCYVERDVSEHYKEQLLGWFDSGRIKADIDGGEAQTEVFYRNIRGNWRRIRVVASEQYSESHPWVIVALDEQDGEMAKQVDDATAQVAVSQIYTLVISVGVEKGEYNCIHYSGALLNLDKHGSYQEFYRQMSEKMPLEDKKVFGQIFDRESYGACSYREGPLRMYDGAGELHYYSYYSVCIRRGVEERILMTLRNIDDKQAMQRRESVLANLCQCYYSIYLFDLENNLEEAVWQEDLIQRRHEFPKGRLDIYYEKFVRNYVFEEDQEKMRRAGSPEFLRKTLSPDQPVYDIDFRRIYPDGIEWARSRFSIAEMKDGMAVKVIFASMNINDQKLKELGEEQQKKIYFEYQNIIGGLSSFYHSVFYIDLLAEKFQAFALRQDIAEYLGDHDSYEELEKAYEQNFIHEEDQERFAHDLSLEEINRRVGGGEMIYSQEYRRDYGGYFGWMRMHVILAASQNGVPTRIILASHNVEEEKEQEEQNKKALLAAYESAKHANEAKSKFLAHMSHDIRTPMNAIIGMTAIAASHMDDPGQVKECLEKIDFSSRYLLQLINEILDMSQIEKGKIDLLAEPFSLKELIREIQAVIRPEAAQKSQSLRFETGDMTHDRLVGDTGRIRQVLINLINNAVKYTPEGGNICVTAQEVSAHTPGNGCFVFTVEDDGIGMDKDFLDYIFVPFSRADDILVRHVQGTGLGMSIAKGIVDAMQGDIQVESERGAGSRFVVSLNLEIAEPVREE